MTSPTLPLGTRIAILARLFTLQGSYNYETMIGNGIAFAMEPALRLLPGGATGAAYCEAMARESRYFNCHPYFAGIAVGALARAELSLEAPDRIERFRTASCGPLGSVGDRLVWAAWLPLCSLIALVAFGLGLGAPRVVIGFLAVYNAGHLALRLWGLHAGWRDGLAVAHALGAPIFRTGPAQLSRAAAFAAGLGFPLAIGTAAGVTPTGVLIIGGIGALGALLLALLHGRVAGWRAAIGLLAVAAAIAVVVR